MLRGPLVVRVLGPGQHLNVDVSCALGNVYYYVLLGLSLWPKQKAKPDQASQYQTQVNDQHSQQPTGMEEGSSKRLYFLQKQFFAPNKNILRVESGNLMLLCA